MISRVSDVHIRDQAVAAPAPGRQIFRHVGAGHRSGRLRARFCMRTARRTVDLEIIGAKGQGSDFEKRLVIAAESRGHMQVCLQACGAR